ncbi:splicing regulatory glutamine/lysine-rich protein 1-like [Stylophora pistillata]|uniref:Btz domain-containing protein n=1 Tax=Stylophora pistillata TaxID=50429 RepID=A0A2B4RKI9_STYPI|nr:splicing regulatory glutamine/lysine-rich protein 1-like [Stylophora pistillata]PFX16762.1 hypothetical protein AWC38_SpisGene18939 [Stylophora pistillata]
MPDRSGEKSRNRSRERSKERPRESSDRKRISSAVVVSKSFQKAHDKRDPIKERRGYRQRSPDNDRESDRGGQRLRMDRDENRREHRKQNISERLGQRPRKTDSQGEREDNEDPSATRWKQRNERYSQQGRGAASNPNRRTVFDRLDSGPPRDRMSNRTQQGGGSWDQRMVEVDVNPQDVPRGKRYFMHDDRELPRRQKSDRSRARSRSPLWVHDKFDDLETDEVKDDEEAAHDDDDDDGDDDTEMQDMQVSHVQERERSRDGPRRRENQRRN